jgi:DNA-binding CsgD family transcriptional regulator
MNLKPLIIIILLLFCVKNGHAKDYFEPVYTLSGDEQTMKMVELYFTLVEPLPNEEAFSQIRAANQKAKALNNSSLEALTIGLRAIHFAYSTSTGANISFVETLDSAKKIVENMPNSYVYNFLLHEAAHSRTMARAQFILPLREMLQADRFFSQMGYDKCPEATRLLTNLGVLFYYFGDYKKALPRFLEAQKYIAKCHYSRNVIGCYNDIALCYRNLAKEDSMNLYYNKALEVAEQTKDTVWIGIMMGNIGQYYMKRKSYDKAKSYFLTAYERVKSRDKGSALENLIYLANVEYLNGNTSQSLDYLAIADKSACLNPTIWARAYKLRADIYEKEGDFRLAYKYRQKELGLKDSISNRFNIQEKAKVEEYIADEQHQAELLRMDNQILKRNMTIAIVTLLALIGFLVARAQISKRKIAEKQALQQKELLKMEQELRENAENQLRQLTDSWAEKYALLLKLQAQYEGDSVPNKSSFDAQNGIFFESKASLLTTESIENEADKMLKIDENSAANLDTLFSTTLLTEDDWKSFSQLFERVHQGFFARLHRLYSDFSPAEIRLIALLRLRFSNKQIANTLGVSPDSVYKARYRLRKKLSLSEQENIEEWVVNI